MFASSVLWDLVVIFSNRRKSYSYSVYLNQKSLQLKGHGEYVNYLLHENMEKNEFSESSMSQKGKYDG